jgi:hypothetical protein
MEVERKSLSCASDLHKCPETSENLLNIFIMAVITMEHPLLAMCENSRTVQQNESDAYCL